MNRLLVFASTVSLLAAALAGCDNSSARSGDKPAAVVAQAAAPAKPLWEAGQPLADAKATSVADVFARASELKDQTIHVEGTVTGVCQHRGCWVEITDGTTKLIARSMDHTIAFPKDATGKRVIIEGALRVGAVTSCGDHEGHAAAGEGAEPHACPRPDTMVEVRRAELHPAS